MTSPSPARQLLLRRAVPALRVELADAATRGRVASPADVAAALSGSGPADADADADADAPVAVDVEARWFAAVLDALTSACTERGEPDLASLVARDADRPAEHLDAERRRCWRHWGGRSAEAAGEALAPLAPA